MKKFSEYKSTRSFRFISALLAFVLIISISFSLFTGLGYSRYAVVSDPVSSSFSAGVLTVGGDKEYTTSAMRNESGDTVIISADKKVKVTVPKDGISSYLQNDTEYSAAAPAAYVLYTKKLSDTYDSVADQYNLQYDVRLYAVYGDNDHYGYAYDVTNGIKLKIQIPEGTVTDYTDVLTANKATICYDSASHSFIYDCSMIRADQNVNITYSRAAGGVSTPNEPPQP